MNQSKNIHIKVWTSDFSRMEESGKTISTFTVAKSIERCVAAKRHCDLGGIRTRKLPGQRRRRKKNGWELRQQKTPR